MLHAAMTDLAVRPLLARVRDAYDGRLVLVKGPEVALDYPEPELRRYGDLDLLADDAEAAQAALLAAGFGEIDDPALYVDIHHLRPLAWPGVPIVIELHSRPKWPDGIPGPGSDELLAAAVPSRLGVAGIETLAPAPHAVLLAAHSWAHEPLDRIGHLVDVAATLARADQGEAAALARGWGCARMWSVTEAAIGAVLAGDGSLPAWARHLPAARERTVLEMHLQRLLAPLAGLPPGRVPGGVVRAVREELRLDPDESWRIKLARSRLAFKHAGVSRAEHDMIVEAREL
jgi:putative nucleotidyltransferase-like protein